MNFHPLTCGLCAWGLRVLFSRLPRPGATLGEVLDVPRGTGPGHSA